MTSSPTESGQIAGSTERGSAGSGVELAANVPVGTVVAPSTAGHKDLRLSGDEPISGPAPIAVLLYSDDVDTRERVRRAIGRKLAADLPPIEWTECATPPAVIAAVDTFGFDVLILDGEASPAGGLGMCKQLKDEKYECPPILVLTGRPQDAWLATWSHADAAVPHPLDPRALAEAVLGLARLRRA